MKRWKPYLKLKHKKYRDEWQSFIVEGKRICREALAAGWDIEVAFCTDDFMNDPLSSEIINTIRQRQITLTILEYSEFKKLADTESPQGILFVVEIPPAPESFHDFIDKEKFVLILDGIRDPGNMGTIMRSADWFGFSVILSTGDCVDFYNPKVIRASMGSIFNVSCREISDSAALINGLIEYGFTIIGTSSDESSGKMSDLIIHPPLALILGSEATGISSRWQTSVQHIVRIPKRGSAESLNVAVAAGIVMYYFTTQLSEI